MQLILLCIYEYMKNYDICKEAEEGICQNILKLVYFDFEYFYTCISRYSKFKANTYLKYFGRCLLQPLYKCHEPIHIHKCKVNLFA